MDGSLSGVRSVDGQGAYSVGNLPVSSGSLWFAVAVIGVVLFFWDGIQFLVKSWAQPEYSYGPLVPIVSGYILLRELIERPPLANGGSRLPGLLVVLIGIALGAGGHLTQIPYLTGYGLIVAIGGLALLVAGIRNGIHYWPGWLHLIFMLPLPVFVYWMLSIKLQLLSSQIGVALIDLIGIPVYLEGNIIDLGDFKLHVAEACSGLRYLFPMMSFGFLFAVLYRGPVWQKGLLFFATVPLTVLMNSFRIGMIGILVNYFGIAQAEGFLHWFEGWVIFITCTLVLYLLGLALQRLIPRSKRHSPILDLEFKGILAPLGWLRAIPSSIFIQAAALLLVVSCIALIFAPSRAVPNVSRELLSNFPMSLAEWRGSTGQIDKATEQALGADDYLVADFRTAEKQANVDLFISYYKSTTDGTGLHSPQICIPGSGWEVSEWRQVQIAVGNEAPFTVNRAIIQKGVNRQLVYYWFEAQGRRNASDYTTKLFTLWDSALKGRADGSLVRLVTPLLNGDTEITAEKRLNAFAGALLPILPRFAPP